MLKMIVPIANSITLTKFGGKQFETLPKPIETKILANTLKEFGFENYCEIEEPQKAIEKLLNIPNDLPIVVTGSFYFLSEFSNYFK
jgi:folylpolyglutamate synthase/dihydropteroate synthase